MPVKDGFIFFKNLTIYYESISHALQVSVQTTILYIIAKSLHSHKKRWRETVPTCTDVGTTLRRHYLVAGCVDGAILTLYL